MTILQHVTMFVGHDKAISNNKNTFDNVVTVLCIHRLSLTLVTEIYGSPQPFIGCRTINSQPLAPFPASILWLHSLARFSGFLPGPSHHPLFDGLTVCKHGGGSPGNILHVYEVNIYLDRQRRGRASNMSAFHTQVLCPIVLQQVAFFHFVIGTAKQKGFKITLMFGTISMLVFCQQSNYACM